jgi:hypothetical protein
VRQAGFRRVLLRTHGVFVVRLCSEYRRRSAPDAFTTINLWLRGDTDFSQTTQLDRWDDDGGEFVFGMDAMKNLVELAKNLSDSAWQELKRTAKTPRQTQQTRAKRPNFKEQFVIEKEYKNKRLEKEFVAEFDYQPVACDRRYRMVVLKKHARRWAESHSNAAWPSG